LNGWLKTRPEGVKEGEKAELTRDDEMDKPFVLIIEDDRDIAALFRHVMDLAGYRTEIATNGTLAVERLSRSLPDIVLLDLTLPGTTGSEILQMMRADDRLKFIPVVVVTAYPELARSLNVEPDLIMLKPVSSSQLTDLVQRLRRTGKKMDLTPFGKTPWGNITGLYNRSFFEIRLDYALKSLKEKGQGLFAVLLVGPSQLEDLGKGLRRRYSQETVRQVAELLKKTVRPTDTIAMFEQDHFFILIENVPDGDIPKLIVSRIQEKLRDLPPVEDEGKYTASIGALLCDSHYEQVYEIQRDIKAVYSAIFAPGQTGVLIFDQVTITQTGRLHLHQRK
jgi:diguanylate cyclase (GGDEF)-like protein